MASNRMFLKLIVVTPKELEDTITRAVETVLDARERERPLRDKVDGAVKRIVLRTAREG